MPHYCNYCGEEVGPDDWDTVRTSTAKVFICGSRECLREFYKDESEIEAYCSRRERDEDDNYFNTHKEYSQ